MFNQLGVIGCGLMGGSFALALKRAGLVRRVIGYSKSPSTTELAKRLGVIDDAAESALLAVAGSDIVLLAVPVAATEATFKAIRHLVEPGVLFMDVGSTKRDVVDTFAAVSHLPHLLAFAYFSAIINQPAGRDFLSLAGPGFRDFTRIAASDPAVWRDILLANREEVLKQTQRFRHSLDAIEHVIKAGNPQALEDLIRGAADGRSGWQIGGGRGGSSGK